MTLNGRQGIHPKSMHKGLHEVEKRRYRNAILFLWVSLALTACSSTPPVIIDTAELAVSGATVEASAQDVLEQAKDLEEEQPENEKAKELVISASTLVDKTKQLNEIIAKNSEDIKALSGKYNEAREEADTLRVEVQKEKTSHWETRAVLIFFACIITFALVKKFILW